MDIVPLIQGQSSAVNQAPSLPLPSPSPSMVRKRVTPTAEAKAKRQQRDAKATLRNRYLSIKSGDYLDAHDFGEVVDGLLDRIDPKLLPILAAHIKRRNTHPGEYHYSVYRGFTENQTRGLSAAQITQLERLTELASLSDVVEDLNVEIGRLDSHVESLLEIVHGGKQ